jgi:hypothetical protein
VIYFFASPAADQQGDIPQHLYQLLVALGDLPTVHTASIRSQLNLLAGHFSVSRGLAVLDGESVFKLLEIHCGMGGSPGALSHDQGIDKWIITGPYIH